MTTRVHFASFPNARALLGAAEACRERGFDVEDAYTPHPVHGLDAILGLRRSRLPFVTLAGGAAGLALGLWFQYWSSATDWPLNVGGKPFDSMPAFLPVAFEMLVLLAGLATAFALFARSRLWPGNARRALRPAVTDDTYALQVARGTGALAESDLDALLKEHGATETWSEERS